MLAVADIDSAWPVPSSRRSPPPMTRTTRCRTPRWYRTPVSAAKNTITGSTWKANTLPSSGSTGPNRNSIPADDASTTVCTAPVTASNPCWPAGQYRTTAPNTTWMASAPRTVRGLIARRSALSATPSP